MATSERPAGDSTLIERALRWNELFSQWPEARRAELSKSARLERYMRRTQVLSHDRHRRELLAVVSGCLEISSLNAGGRKYLNALLGPGRVVPLVRLLEDVPLPYDLHAHEDSVIIHLPSDAVLAALDAEPLLWRDVARLSLRRQRQTVLMLGNQILGTVRRRVAVALLNIAQHYGTQDGDGAGLRVGLTQQDLATMLGLSRQAINRELGALVEAGVVDLAYKRVLILDTERLEHIAAGQ